MIAADPVALLRFTVSVPSVKDLNVIGVVPHGVGAPVVREGRALAGTGEVVADRSLGCRARRKPRARRQQVPRRRAHERDQLLRRDAGRVRPDRRRAAADARRSAARDRGRRPRDADRRAAGPARAHQRGGEERPAPPAEEGDADDRLPPGAVVDHRRGHHRLGAVSPGARAHARLRGVQGDGRVQPTLLGGIALQAMVLAIAAAVAALVLLSWLLTPTMAMNIEIPRLVVRRAPDRRDRRRAGVECVRPAARGHGRSRAGVRRRVMAEAGPPTLQCAIS